MHNDNVGIINKYKVIASFGNSRANNILLKILKSLDIAVLADNIKKELIIFLFMKQKHFLYVEFSSIIDEVGVDLQ